MPEIEDEDQYEDDGPSEYMLDYEDEDAPEPPGYTALAALVFFGAYGVANARAP